MKQANAVSLTDGLRESEKVAYKAARRIRASSSEDSYWVNGQGILDAERVAAWLLDESSLNNRPCSSDDYIAKQVATSPNTTKLINDVAIAILEVDETKHDEVKAAMAVTKKLARAILRFRNIDNVAKIIARHADITESSSDFGTINRILHIAINMAIEEERERCAKLADEHKCPVTANAIRIGIPQCST